MRDQEEIVRGHAREFGIPEYLVDELIEALDDPNPAMVKENVGPRIDAVIGAERSREFRRAINKDLLLGIAAARVTFGFTLQ